MRPLRFLAALLMLAAATWLAGFAWFLHVAAMNPGPPPAAEGIVALTGGAERVETAMRLLADGRGQLLLVSGVGGDAAFGDLARRAGVDPSLRGRVTLGRMAASTRGNAEETAEWVRSHSIRSLIVVTAAYHMPRALAELSRTLPGVALYPLPVQREDAAGPSWRLVAAEYSKWLIAEAGLSSLTSRAAPAARLLSREVGAARPAGVGG